MLFRHTSYMVFILLVLSLSVHLLHTIHTHVLAPVCAIPLSFISTTKFCVVVAGQLQRQQSSTVVVEASSTSGLTDKYLQSYDWLVQQTLDAFQVMRDIRDFDIALEDLKTLVRLSDLPDRVIILEHLVQIKSNAGRSASHLQAYTSRLYSGLSISVHNAYGTATLFEPYDPFQKSLLNGIVCTFFDIKMCHDNEAINSEEAFYQMLQQFDTLSYELLQANGLTQDALSDLEADIDALRSTLNRSLSISSEEVGELLGRLWTKLGGNKTKVRNAKGRYQLLCNTGRQSTRMRDLTALVRRELVNIRTMNEEWRSYASVPLLAETKMPKDLFLRTLASGLEDLKAQVQGIKQQQDSLARGPYSSKPLSLA